MKDKQLTCSPTPPILTTGAQRVTLDTAYELISRQRSNYLNHPSCVVISLDLLSVHRFLLVNNYNWGCCYDMRYTIFLGLAMICDIQYFQDNAM
jgi:hypothetical protein